MKYPQPSATALWLIRNLECDTGLIGMIRNHPQPDFNLSATWERLERGKLGTSTFKLWVAIGELLGDLALCC